MSPCQNTNGLWHCQCCYDWLVSKDKSMWLCLSLVVSIYGRQCLSFSFKSLSLFCLCVFVVLVLLYFINNFEKEQCRLKFWEWAMFYYLQNLNRPCYNISFVIISDFKRIFSAGIWQIAHGPSNPNHCKKKIYLYKWFKVKMAD